MIPPSGTQQIITNPNLTADTMQDQIHNITVKTGRSKVEPDHIFISTDITAQIFMIHTEAVQGHNIKIITDTTGVAHNIHTPPIEVTAINLTVTHHIDLITDHPHIEAILLTTPEITVDHTPSLPTNPPGDIHNDQLHIPGDHEVKKVFQEESKSENRRSTHGLLQLWWTFQWLRRGIRSFKLAEPPQVVTPMNREGYLYTTRLQWHLSWIVQPLQYMQTNTIRLL